MKLTYTKRAAATLIIRRILFLCLLVTGYLLIGVPEASAQGDDPMQLAPPPIKIISKVENDRLNAAKNHKARTKLIIEMMRARVVAAERLNSVKDHPAMFTELGGFHALMDNGLEHLKKLDADDKKVLDTFKRLEIGLREFPPRLEAIRRDLPLRYEDYVRRLIRYLRVARTIATEPLFGDTVLPSEPQNKNETPKL